MLWSYTEITADLQPSLYRAVLGLRWLWCVCVGVSPQVINPLGLQAGHTSYLKHHIRPSSGHGARIAWGAQGR